MNNNTKVNRTSDSMKASPMNSASWMPGRAPGFRASASATDAATLPWPSPAKPAARPMPIPMPIGPQFVAAGAPPDCAYTGDAIIRIAIIRNKNASFLVIISPYQVAASGWLTSVLGDSALTLAACYKQPSTLVLFADRHSQIHQREHHKDERLHQ